MDAYSHHPYTPGGSTRIAGRAAQQPRPLRHARQSRPADRLFPSKPFYLTEFGYNTQYSHWFGVTVSKADQARYLREAYAYVSATRRSRRCCGSWSTTGTQPAGADKAGEGVYMGVRTYKGERKPSWYAFAGGNTLTLAAPASAKARSLVHGLRQADVPLARRTGRPGAHAAVARAIRFFVEVPGVHPHGPADGTYSREVTQSKTRVYRVVRGGVCESAARTVKTP